MLIQLDLFEQDEDVLLRKEIEKIKISTEKVRKSLFAKHGDLSKLYIELDHRLGILERYICRREK
jgi:hypothetical protein